MEMLIILTAWIAIVGVADALVTRPWKTPAARAPLPMALGILAAAWVIITGYLSYQRMMADGAWTGATIAMAFVPAKAIGLSLLAYGAGRAFLSARIGGGPPVQRWAAPALLISAALYFLASDVIAMRANALERHAANPALTAEEVSALTQRVRSGSAQEGEVFAFLGNPRCPVDLLTKYASAHDPYARTAVARNDAITPELAEKLAGDPDEQVRYYLAFNRKLPPAILSRLAADASDSVRDTVAWTDALSDEDFDRLVNDPSPKVRATAALQSRLSAEQLEKLRNDPEERVRNAAGRWGTK